MRKPFLLTLCLVILAPPAATSAATLEVRDYTRRIRDNDVSTSVDDVDIGIIDGSTYPDFDVPKGETRHVRAHIEAKSSLTSLDDHRIDVAPFIYCTETVNGATVANTTSKVERNHDGSGTSAGYDTGNTSVGYPATGVLALEIEILAIAHTTSTSTPSHFHCALRGEFHVAPGVTATVTFLGADTQGAHTWIEWSSPSALDTYDDATNTGNAQWTTNNASCNTGSSTTTADDYTQAACVHLVRPISGDTTWPTSIKLFATGNSAYQLNDEAKRVAHASATTVTAIAAVELTSCPNVNPSNPQLDQQTTCREEMAPYAASVAPSTAAGVRTQLVFSQLDNAGLAAGETGSTCSRQAKTPLRWNTITSRTHHFMITHKVPLQLSTQAGCSRTVRAYLYIEAASGVPIKLDRSNYTRMIFLNGVTGADSIGWYRDGGWHLRNALSAGASDYVTTFGASGTTPVTGDWDGDGKTGIGWFNPADGSWHLADSPTGTSSDHYTNGYGGTGTIPVTGDWDGDGKTGIGWFRPSDGSWHLANSATATASDYVFTYGVGGVPITGDWNGDGKTTIGWFSNGFWHLSDSLAAGDTYVNPSFGTGGTPVTGDWDNDGKTGIGWFGTDGRWHLANSVLAVTPDYETAAYGDATTKPITGDWNGI